MTPPVMTDDLIQGAATYLLTRPEIVAALGTTPDGDPLLFQHAIYTNMEGTSTNAAVIARAGGWAGANTYNTARFPRIALDLWCDPIRTLPGEVWRRLEALFELFDKALHRPQGGDQWWGTVRTISCVRMAEPAMYAVPDGNGLLRAETFYAIEQG